MLPLINLTLLPMVLILVVRTVDGHGYMAVPPGRASMWREGFDNPTNYNDNEQFCGGFAHQVQQGYKCGFCGDPYDGPYRHEYPGQYASTDIVRTYRQGQAIDVEVRLTAAHKGYFEFYLCKPENHFTNLTDFCNDKDNKKLLNIKNGGSRLDIDVARQYNLQVWLPTDISCDFCLLQWRYHAGNNWGTDSEGSGVGHGPQEEFYSCANIAIEGTTGGSGGGGGAGGGGSGGAGNGGGAISTSTAATTTTQQQTGQCRGAGLWAGILDDWCILNCAAGYCPLSHCAPSCR